MASAGSAQSRTVVATEVGTSCHASATAQLAEPVPPPMSVCVAGVHVPAASRNAPSAERTASNVAGIRYAA
ncbi:hypothetical protein DWB77_05422 [Streptomyces hundungensis]|uniref:Uncharacterized protein n=1 Tax=Streptomyces hundungensis TaxID=1077946 RepID=A0A387HHA4_9ACTN|nr:hypothetical protein DWB77_05422 [Streptomyces hundungensis]